MKAVILAGGKGTRLWPISREAKPKQFHALTGSSTLLQEAYARLDFLSPSDIYIATNEPYLAETKRQLPQVKDDHFIVEPAMRDTAPSIGLAAVTLATHHSDEAMAIIYSDCIIQRKDEFMRKLTIAAELAEKENTLNVIVVKAKFPNPNLGYVKVGKLLRETKDGVEIYELEHYVEKPDYETAKKYMFSYKYLWNTGIYVWKVKTILEQFKKHAPDMYRALNECRTSNARARKTECKRAFQKCPKISIDYAIMEKVDPREVRVIPSDLGWSDIGSWASLYGELVEGENENLVRGEFLGLGTTSSVIYGKRGKLIATLGLSDMVIIDTDDALLVCPKEKSAELKKLIEELKKQNKEKYL